MDLTIGCLGIIWVMGAFMKQNFPGNRSDFRAGLALAGATLLFLSGIPYGFSSVSTADSANLFGFIGRILGLVGCARAMYVRFPKA